MTDDASATPPERPHYLEKQVLQLCDLVDEQDYRVEMWHQHEFNLHDDTKVAAGVVCGPQGYEMALEPVFALRVRRAGNDVRELLAITAEGACELAEGLSAQDVTADVVHISPLDGVPAQAKPWNCYRPGGADGRESRIELEPPLIPGAADRSRFVVGTSSSSDFVPVLMVDAGGNTTVRGRLTVHGPIVHAAPDGVSPDAPALGVSLRVKDKTTVEILVVNLSPKLISALTIVVVTPGQKPKSVPCKPLLKTEGMTDASTTVDSKATTATVTAFGVLPGGVLCHASGALDLS
jgi:hypothetical protein